MMVGLEPSTDHCKFVPILLNDGSYSGEEVPLFKEVLI